MDAPVTYTADFLDHADANEAFGKLWNGLDWERREGVPRREYWANDFNRDYTYGSGRGIRAYSARPFTEMILATQGKLLHDIGVWFEGCFLNGYENSKDALGPHSDDDPGIDHSRPIAIVTLYLDPKLRPRTIQFRPIIRQRTEADRGEFGPWETLELGHGSLALMAPGMQFTHQHQIPKAGFVASPRISLTFRGLVETTG
jgi:alkylated DNA repair dioxygenase AlkB